MQIFFSNILWCQDQQYGLHATQKKATRASRKWNLKQNDIFIMKNKVYFSTIQQRYVFFRMVFLRSKISMGGAKTRVSYVEKYKWLPFLNFFATQPVFLIKAFLINSNCVYIKTFLSSGHIYAFGQGVAELRISTAFLALGTFTILGEA